MKDLQGIRSSCLRHSSELTRRATFSWDHWHKDTAG